MTDLAIGLVGCGRLAELGYVPALRAARGVRLVAVADPQADRREHVARLAGDGRAPVMAVTGAADLLDAGLDGVVLATPSWAHLPDARMLAEAGVPSLVEKPPAPDAATAAQLTGLAPAPRLGFNRRFEPRVDRLRRVAAVAGWVDCRVVLRYRRRSWQAHTIRDDALLDLGPHVIDLARWITGGEVTAVTTAAATERSAVLDLELTRGRARVQCAVDRPHREELRLWSASGRPLAEDRAGGLVAGVRARLGRGGQPHPLAASLTAQVEAWGRVLAGDDDATLATARDGVAVMAGVDAARTSAQAGGVRTPVDLPISQLPT